MNFSGNNPDNYIKQGEKEIREYRKKRSKLESDIIDYIVNNKINKSDIKIGNSKLRYHENKTKCSFNKTFIKKNLEEYFLEKHSNLGKEKCENLANDIYTYLENSRTFKIKLGLKRIALK